jgi:hypothetical protein
MHPGHRGTMPGTSKSPFIPGNLATNEIRLNIGAGEGIRTLDPDLGKVVLYP